MAGEMSGVEHSRNQRRRVLSTNDTNGTNEFAAAYLASVGGANDGGNRVAVINLGTSIVLLSDFWAGTALRCTPQSGATTKPGVAKRTPGGGTEGEEPQRGSTIDAARSDGANGEVIRANRVVLFNPVGVGGLNVTGSWGARARPQALMWHAAGVRAAGAVAARESFPQRGTASNSSVVQSTSRRGRSELQHPHRIGQLPIERTTATGSESPAGRQGARRARQDPDSEAPSPQAWKAAA